MIIQVNFEMKKNDFACDWLTRRPKAIIYGGVAGGVALLILIIIIVVCVVRRRRRHDDGANEQVNKNGKFDILFVLKKIMNWFWSIIETVAAAPSNHYGQFPAADDEDDQRAGEQGDIALSAVKKSNAPNNEYERGDIALGKVNPNNAQYGRVSVRASQYNELQLKAPGTDYADASVLRWMKSRSFHIIFTFFRHR